MSLTYKGPGFIQGIGRRDVSDAELETLRMTNPELYSIVLSSPAYENPDAPNISDQSPRTTVLTGYDQPPAQPGEVLQTAGGFISVPTEAQLRAGLAVTGPADPGKVHDEARSVPIVNAPNMGGPGLRDLPASGSKVTPVTTVNSLNETHGSPVATGSGGLPSKHDASEDSTPKPTGGNGPKHSDKK